MRMCWIAALLMLAAGCATTRVVHLDTGQGRPIVYTPVASEPVEIDEDAFRSAVARLVLDLRLDVGLEQSSHGEGLSLLASNAGVVDGARGHSIPSAYERMCRQQSDPAGCLSLLAGGLALGPMERRLMALSFAFDTVWEGVEEAVKDLTSPTALRAMVVSVIGTAMLMLVAPEPITKLIAIGLTASLIGYLGTGPVWNLGQGFLRLMEESQDARSFSELEQVGHRFGKVLGDNGARVLVVAALAALGGRNAMAARGSKMPGFAQAAARAQAEGGFRLPAAFTGEVQAISISSAGVLNVALAPTAVAAVAMGPGGGMLGDPEGDIHHICTNKNEVSEASGGPWTPRYEELFEQANLSMEAVANKVRIKGHKGPHPREYHEAVFQKLSTAMRGCRDVAQCRAALVQELVKIAQELMTPGSELRTLVTMGAE